VRATNQEPIITSYYDSFLKEAVWGIQTSTGHLVTCTYVHYMFEQNGWYVSRGPKIFSAVVDGQSDGQMIFTGPGGPIGGAGFPAYFERVYNPNLSIPSTYLLTPAQTSEVSNGHLGEIVWPWTYFRDPTHDKEIRSIFVDYTETTGSGLKVYVQTHGETTRNAPLSTSEWIELDKWESARASTRTPLKGYRMRFKLAHDGTVAPVNTKIYALIAEVYGLPKPRRVPEVEE
jgi:hypothetical protein